MTFDDDEVTNLAMARMGGPSRVNPLNVRFLMEPMEVPEESKAQGRPIYRDAEIIEIRIPGQLDCIRREVTERDKKEHGKLYEAFKNAQNQDAVLGTPIEQWPVMKRGQVEEARYLGIRTVEQLADVSDGNLRNLGPGWLEIRQKARDWLKAAKDRAFLSQLRAERDELAQRVGILEDIVKKQTAELHGLAPASRPAAPQNDELATLKAAVAELLAAKVKRKPGRPRKVTEPNGTA